MSHVHVRAGESLDQAIKRFKKMTMESGILKEFRAHEHFEKPSERRRREAAARMRKIMRAKRQQEARDNR